jgi:hypothetical protein
MRVSGRPCETWVKAKRWHAEDPSPESNAQVNGVIEAIETVSQKKAAGGRHEAGGVRLLREATGIKMRRAALPFLPVLQNHPGYNCTQKTLRTDPRDAKIDSLPRGKEPNFSKINSVR